MIAALSPAHIADMARIAEARIRPWLRETPLERAPDLDDRLGGPVWLKLENFQHTGSFKARGALSKVMSAPDDGRHAVTASSGNHGAGVAYALAAVGRKGLVFVPEGADSSKVAAIRARGAEVRFHGRDMVETEAHARAVAERDGGFYIPPYNDIDVIAGQATLGLELLRQAPEIARVFVAVGGGGLIAGVASVLKSARPDIEVIGCSPSASAVMARSVEAGRLLDLESDPTLSDGTAGGIEPDSVTFPLCRDLVGRWIEADEGEIAAAMRLLLDRHLLAEGAAGMAMACALKAPPAPGPSIVVICGANVGRDALRSVL